MSENTREMLKEEDLNTILTVTSDFKIMELMMKGDSRWRLKIFIAESLKKIYKFYSLRLYLNEEVYDTRIKHLEEKIEKIEEQNQLFPDNQQKDISKLKTEIVTINNERDEMLEKCIIMEFTAQTGKFEYKNGGTVFTFLVPDTIIDSINQQKVMLGHYQVDLTPIL